ncbi:unnamed protein product, partial [Staurois parvus]
LESSGGVLYTTASDALHCTLGDGRLGCSCSAMETHSMKLSTLRTVVGAHLKATPSLEVFSYYGLCRQLVTSAHCALQHALTPPCHVTWPTTWWP